MENEVTTGSNGNDAVDREILQWLVGIPSSDINFKGNLARANEATVRAALAEVEGKEGNKTAETALKRRLKAILQESLDAATATNRQLNKVEALEMGTILAERDAQKQAEAAQVERENLIAQCYKAMGQIQAADMISNFAGAVSFVWLKEVKERKVYRGLPGIGTWEKFCESVGMSKTMVDDGIRDLRTFGENFLTAAGNLKVGYRDLRKLRYLVNEGEVVIDQDANVITVGEEKIPIDGDHTEDLQAAIEKVIEEKTSLTQQVEKLKKNVDEVVKEETKSLKAEVKALVKEVKRLKPFDPEEKDRSFCAEQMEEIRDVTMQCIATMSKFIIRDDIQGDVVILGQVEGHIQMLEMCLGDLRKRWEEKVNLYER